MEKKLETKKPDSRKLSYEELENVCHQLSAQAQQLSTQNKQLRVALNESNLTNLYKRLDYLYLIIDKDNKYLSTEFKEKCAKEFETLMASPEDNSTTTEDNKGE